MLPGASSILFQPASAAVIDRLLDDLRDPSASLTDLAHRHGTTTEALCAWMSSPDIGDRLVRTDSIVAWRTRILASGGLTPVIAALTRILTEFTSRPPVAAARDQAAAAPHADPDPRSALLSWRADECARKCCALLLRLTTTRPVGHPGEVQPLPPPAPAHRDQAPPPAPARERPIPFDPSIAIAALAAAPIQPPAPLAEPNEPALEIIAPAKSSSATAQTSANTAAIEQHPAESLPASSPSATPATSPEAQLEDFLFNLLQSRPALEPAFQRFVAELQSAEPQLTKHPP
jgi:hypothetical protein